MRKWFKNKENYRHRNYDFRRKRKNKRILIFVVILLIIGFVMFKDIGGIKTSIQKKLNSLNLSSLISNVISFNNYCEENIIPNNFTFYQNQIISGIDENVFSNHSIIYLRSPIWKDGTPFGPSIEGIPFMNSYDCRMGKEEGENINYLYCKNIGYGKQVNSMDANGNIIKIEDFNYRIDLVVDMKNPLGKRTLIRKDMYGFERNLGEELTFNKVVDYECKRI